MKQCGKRIYHAGVTRRYKILPLTRNYPGVYSSMEILLNPPTNKDIARNLKKRCGYLDFFSGESQN